MKKNLLALILCFVIGNAFAQDLRFGAKFAYNSTWMFNTNISDQGEAINYASAFGPSYGLTTTIFFTEKVGINLDLLWSTHNAKYTGQEITSSSFEATSKFSYFDIPILLRIGNSDGGGYVEIGPQIGFLTGAKETRSGFINYDDVDFKNDYNGTNIAAVLGFGYDIQVNDNWFINTGLRFAYGFSDVTKEQPSEAAYIQSLPHSVISEYAHKNTDGDFSYKNTNRVFGGLNIGIIYKPD